MAQDAFGFALHYYERNNGGGRSPLAAGLDYSYQDYVSIQGSPFAPIPLTMMRSREFKPLFNGNIAAMAVNIGKFNNPVLYNYGYDQLNRLKQLDAWNGLNSVSNTWDAGFGKMPDYHEELSYDANGNILGYRRDGFGNNLAMDNLAYSYNRDAAGRLLNNRLRSVQDGVTSSSSAYNDIKSGQIADNYTYDEIDNLTGDDQEGITAIQWTVYGKIASIVKRDGTRIGYSYDAAGHRISKTVNGQTSWYVRDASGNVMGVYVVGDPATNSGHMSLSELDIYGSSRLGMLRADQDLTVTASGRTPIASLNSSYGFSTFIRGKKFFELTNHLGNVLVTVTDKKQQHSTDGVHVDYFAADVASANDYYPFGMQMPGRSYNAGGYRYGFNGKENDNEVKGVGNEIDYGMRVYDPRVGRFMSLDPLTPKYPELTPYQYASNRPIDGVDMDGLEYEASNPSTALAIGNLFLPKTMQLTDQQLKEQGAAYDKAQRMGTAIGVGLSIDLYTGGKISQFLFSQQLFSAFQHNKASTPEGRALQNQNSKEALTDALITWGAGKILGVALDVSISGLRGLARNRFNFAKDFYETAGFAPERATSHINGIDLTKTVTEETYKKGTVLEQWTYLDKEGKPIIGDYFALPGADPSKLGIPLEGRVKTTVILSEDTKFLKSTSADIKDWTPGSNRELKGGETQLFQTGVKYEVKK